MYAERNPSSIQSLIPKIHSPSKTTEIKHEKMTAFCEFLLRV